jgi:dUTP pyrophosphatase
MKIEVKCKLNHPDAKLPTQAYEYDAGWDLYAVENVVVSLGEVREVKTGVHFEIPSGYVGIIFTRSSYGKKGKVVHSGVIDSGYRGEVSVFVRNSTMQTYSSLTGLPINKGDKVAQIIFFKLPQVNLIQVDELSESERGEKGYGSSGK